jgi:hypothetical protein
MGVNLSVDSLCEFFLIFCAEGSCKADRQVGIFAYPEHTTVPFSRSGPSDAAEPGILS